MSANDQTSRKCIKCGNALNDNNWFKSFQKLRFCKCNKCHNETGKVYIRNERRKLRKKLLSIFGNKCINCGFSDFRALQIDHINGGGKKEMRSFGNARNYYSYLSKLSVAELKAKYQLLCANCNWIKRYNNKEIH